MKHELTILLIEDSLIQLSEQLESSSNRLVELKNDEFANERQKEFMLKGTSNLKQSIKELKETLKLLKESEAIKFPSAESIEYNLSIEEEGGAKWAISEIKKLNGLKE